MMKFAAFVVVLFVALFTVACNSSGSGDTGPTGPVNTTPDVSGTWDAIAVVEANSCPFDIPDDTGQITITQSGSQLAMTFLGFVMNANITMQGLITGTATHSFQVEGFTVNVVRTLQINVRSNNLIVGSIQSDIFIPATGESCTFTDTITLSR